MPTTTRLIPLRPLPSLSSGPPSQVGRTTQSARDSIEPVSPLGTYGVSQWDQFAGGLFSGGKGFDSSEKESIKLPEPQKKLTPDQEFYSLSALYSPLRDSFSVIEIASDMGIRVQTLRSYLPSTNGSEGVGQYEMNAQIVQGLLRPTGVTLDYRL